MSDQSMRPPETPNHTPNALTRPAEYFAPSNSTPFAPPPPPSVPQPGPSRPVPPPIDTSSIQQSSPFAPSGRGRGRGRGGTRGRGSRSTPIVTGTRVLPARSSTRNVTYNDDEQPIRRSTKLSLKINGRNSSKNTSFLGEYDRELDDDPTEPLHFEEQFILRVPKDVAVGKGEGTGTGLRELAKGKGKGLEGVEFKFLDPRRAVFRFNGKTYASKLVDLPNIIEAQKTFDKSHFFKIADISQMLVVENQVHDESSITSSALNVDDYIWQHGLTPPLRHARKRRFRKRLSRRHIEVVEEQVEALVKRDQEADLTHYDLFDINSANPDVDDEYYINYEENQANEENAYQDETGSQYDEGMYRDPGSVAPSQAEDWGEDGEQMSRLGDGDMEDGGFDEELAAELAERGTDQSGESDDGVDEEDEDDDDEGEKDHEEEEDEETAEKRAKVKQLSGEIKALESLIERKRADFKGGNPIMIRRFEETIRGLDADVKTKLNARVSIQAELDAAAAANVPPPAPMAARPESMLGGDKSRPAGEDGELGSDADGDSQAGTSAAGTPAGTPGTPGSYEDDDLFGEAEGEAEGENTGSAAGGTPMEVEASTPAEEDGQDEDEDEGEGVTAEEEMPEDEENEMERLLREELEREMEGDADDGGMAELAGLVQDDTVNAGASIEGDITGSPGIGMGEIEGGDEAMQVLEDFNQSLAAGGTGYDGGDGFVEGGVGMRRLVEGAHDDGNDSSSDDSDD